MHQAGNFPFLTPAEFDVACQAFLSKARNSSSTFAQCAQWMDGYLRIVKDLTDCQRPVQGPDEFERGEHEDPAEMPRFETRRSSSQIYFDVVLSATYQLPVLYFDVRDALGQGDRSIDGIYSALVPETIRPQVEQVGIRGAISMADHPFTNTPSFFVHPCNTAQAMSDAKGSQVVSLEHYLVLWLGLVGQCVGLYVPLDMAKQN